MKPMAWCDWSNGGVTAKLFKTVLGNPLSRIDVCARALQICRIAKNPQSMPNICH
jgi:hypothetical protein